MAQTRGATGNARPRIFNAVSTEPTRKHTGITSTKKTPGTTTTKATTSAGITKKRGPKKTSLKEKVEGVAEKVMGTVEGKPGKKAAGTKKINGTAGTTKTSRAARVKV
jgi:hypothetical protein